jgi:taurine dioxygenase
VLFATTAANNAAGSYDHLEVRPLTGALGAELFAPGGGPLDVCSLTDEQWAEVRRASVDHLVVFFRDQSLDLDTFTAFAERWGPFGDDPFVAGVDSHPHVVRVLKEADERVPLVFGGAWHSDWSFQEQPPAFTILYGHDVPDHGGDTLWANLYLAADHLSPGLRSTLAGLRAVHSPQKAYGTQASHNDLVEHMAILYGEEAHVRRSQPILRRHPDSERTALFVNWGYTESVEGWRADESAALLDHLYEVSQHPAYSCRFRWRPGSIAVWDNRCTLHNPIADYAGQRREMWRITIRGEEPQPGT